MRPLGCQEGTTVVREEMQREASREASTEREAGTFSGEVVQSLGGQSGAQSRTPYSWLAAQGSGSRQRGALEARRPAQRLLLSASSTNIVPGSRSEVLDPTPCSWASGLQS